jgi:hypothetical protein
LNSGIVSLDKSQVELNNLLHSLGTAQICVKVFTYHLIVQQPADQFPAAAGWLPAAQLRDTAAQLLVAAAQLLAAATCPSGPAILFVVILL